MLPTLITGKGALFGLNIFRLYSQFLNLHPER